MCAVLFSVSCVRGSFLSFSRPSFVRCACCSFLQRPSFARCALFFSPSRVCVVLFFPSADRLLLDVRAVLSFSDRLLLDVRCSFVHLVCAWFFSFLQPTVFC